MRVCDVCKKQSVIQKTGAHQYGGGWAMRAHKTRKVWEVNLHSAKVTHMGVRRTMRLCTKCLRRVKAEMLKNPVKKYVKELPVETQTPAVSVAAA